MNLLDLEPKELLERLSKDVDNLSEAIHQIWLAIDDIKRGN